MTNIPHIPRQTQAREAGVDYFEEGFRSEEEGLGGAEGTVIFNSVQEQLTPDGLYLKYHCNCTKPVGVVISWSECAAIAHRVQPNHPQVGLSNDPWVHVPREGGFAPAHPCRNGCSPQESRRVVIPYFDAEKKLKIGIANRFPGANTDPFWPRAVQLFPDLVPLLKQAGY